MEYFWGSFHKAVGCTCRGHIDLDTQGGIYIYIYIYIITPPIPPTPNPVRCVGIPAGAFFSEKMTSLEISDMYLVDFDIFYQYLNNIWSMFVQQVSVQVYMSPILVDYTSQIFS